MRDLTEKVGIEIESGDNGLEFYQKSTPFVINAIEMGSIKADPKVLMLLRSANRVQKYGFVLYILIFTVLMGRELRG